MKKRLLATLLCLCMAAMLLPTAALAANETINEDITTGTKEITGTGNCLGADITVQKDATLHIVGSAVLAGNSSAGEKWKITVASGGTLTINNEGSLKDLTVVLDAGAKLAVGAKATFENVNIEKNADDTGGSTINFFSENGATRNIGINEAKVGDAGLYLVGNNKQYVGYVQGNEGDKATICLTSYLPTGDRYGPLPDFLDLVLRNGEEQLEGTQGDNVKETVTENGNTITNEYSSYTFEIQTGQQYDICVNFCGYEIELGKSVIIYNDDTASKIIKRNAEKAEFVIGQSKKLFDVECPAGLTVTAEVEPNYRSLLSVANDGTITALGEIDKQDVDFTFTVTYPGGSSKKHGVIIEKFVAASPVSAPERQSLYVNQRTRVFETTIPDGYALTKVVADDSSVIVSTDDRGEYITVKQVMSNKNVEFTFTFETFENETTQHTFEVKHDVRITTITDGGGYTPSYYTLRFDTNGGSAIERVRRVYGTTVDLSGYTPTREGYTFDGWYADEGLTEKITSVRMTGSKTVYAGWSEIIPVTPEPVVNPFTDVAESDWFFENVMYVYENELMTGTSDTLFDPYGTTTRAMIATVLWRMEGSPAPTGGNPFTDVEDGQWYTDAITWAAENGIAEGYGGGLFGTNAPVTREQLAAFLYRYAEYKGYDLSADAGLAFADALDASDWAFDALCWCTTKGIINGKDNNMLDPKGNAARAEFAAMLQRFIGE